MQRPRSLPPRRWRASLAAAKKPAAKTVACKPGADGKLPDGCKAADAKKKPLVPVTASN